jgi:hypothetical protein
MCSQIIFPLARSVPSEGIATQLFNVYNTSLGMGSQIKNQDQQLREDIIHQLEPFPVEVLEATLLVLQMRESVPAKRPVSRS